MRRMIEVKEYNDRVVFDKPVETKPAFRGQFVIGADTKEDSVVCNEIIIKDGICHFHLHAFKDASVANAYTTDLFQFPAGARPEKNHGFVIVKQSAIGTSAGFARDTEGHCNFYGWTANTEQEYDFSGSFILPSAEVELVSMSLNGR